MGRTLDLPSVIELAPCKYKRVYLNEVKVLLMANVHGGNLHHIYADTEILSVRLLIKLG
jgi:hypothetical protein